jgi:hypothetical protein
VISVVNPMTTITIKQSTGYATSVDGGRIPTYATPVSVQAQVQPLQYTDLQQLDGLNLTGIRRAIYLNGNWRGIIRVGQDGGDLVTLPDGSIWLVVFVFEDWFSMDGWVKLAVTLQNGS